MNFSLLGENEQAQFVTTSPTGSTSGYHPTLRMTYGRFFTLASYNKTKINTVGADVLDCPRKFNQTWRGVKDVAPYNKA